MFRNSIGVCVGASSWPGDISTWCPAGGGWLGVFRCGDGFVCRSRGSRYGSGQGINRAGMVLCSGFFQPSASRFGVSGLKILFAETVPGFGRSIFRRFFQPFPGLCAVFRGIGCFRIPYGQLQLRRGIVLSGCTGQPNHGLLPVSVSIRSVQETSCVSVLCGCQILSGGLSEPLAG